jgi:hypothetical protein
MQQGMSDYRRDAVETQLRHARSALEDALAGVRDALDDY